MFDLAGGKAAIPSTVGLVILMIVMVAVVRHDANGWKWWMIGFILLAVLGYLLVSAEVLGAR